MAQQPAARGQAAVSAKVALALGVSSMAALAVGSGGSLWGLLSPFLGFRIFGVGLLLGLGGLLFGIVGAVRTRPSSGRAGAPQAWAGIALGALALIVAALAAAPGAGLPAINDITTDPADPPRFVAAARLEANRDRDMETLESGFGEQIRAAYPDLEPIRLDVPPDEALRRAERAARDIGLDIVEVAPDAGRLEAYEMSGIFRFVDDFVVRVRPAPDGSGSILDVRSKSRVGRGDLGANAERIRRFRGALRAQVSG